jgi:hypothetical protein
MAASYRGRSDHGLPNLQCRHFGAVLWHSERVGGTRGSRDIVYNRCCKNGNISMPPNRPRPEPLASLARFNGAASCQRFMREIRQYNCLFAFTSMGAQIDRSVNDGRGPPVFKISGQVHHRIGSLVPPDDGPPKFIQFYIYDTTNEIRNRLHSLDAEHSATRSLSPSIVNALMRMLDDHNPFVKKLRTARERLQEHPEEEFIIRIVGAREGDAVQYNLPTTDDLAMLVVMDFSLETFKRDIVIETRNK